MVLEIFLQDQWLLREVTMKGYLKVQVCMMMLEKWLLHHLLLILARTYPLIKGK